MTADDYRKILNNEYENKELTKDDFNNTLTHFAKLHHKEASKELVEVLEDLLIDCLERDLHSVFTDNAKKELENHLKTTNPHWCGLDKN